MSGEPSSGGAVDERVSPSEVAAWRYAAARKGLYACDASGAPVEPARATRDGELRGTVRDRQVCVSYDRASRLTTVRVELARPLLLGIEAHAWVPPRAPDGRSLGGFRTAQIGIDQARVNELFTSTPRGRALADAMREMGARGWIELADGHVQAELEVHAKDERLYVGLLREAVAIAIAAEEARSELAPAPWEEALVARLEAAAHALRLRFDPARFEVVGEVSGAAVESRLAVVGGSLAAGRKYSLFARATFAEPLPADVFVEPRVGFTSKLPLLFGARRPTKNRRFNWLFVASEAIDRVLDDDAMDALADLVDRSAAAAMDAVGVRFRTTRLDVDVAGLLGRLIEVRTRITRRRPASPYR